METLSEIGIALEGSLGPQFVSLYLVGSFGTDRQIPTSDVDLILITTEALEEKQLDELWAVRDRYRESTGEIIDINPRPLQQILKRGMALKSGSRLLCGRDIRVQIAEQSIDDRIAQLTAAALMFSKRIRNVEHLDLGALRPPRPHDAYLGFVDPQRTLPLKSIMSYSFHAAARLAARTRTPILDKHEIPESYGNVFTDWSVDLVRALFAKVRTRWHYEMPADDEGREELRTMCCQIVDFESIVFSEVIQQDARTDALTRATQL